MLKGVNKQVVEVVEVDNEFFERAILFIKPEQQQHGEEALRRLAAQDTCCGVLMAPMDKSTLFPAVEKGGPLPRKTFSMGEAHEKRFYLECRRITAE